MQKPAPIIEEPVLGQETERYQTRWHAECREEASAYHPWKERESADTRILIKQEVSDGRYLPRLFHQDHFELRRHSLGAIPL